jgi:sulfur-oxidizing protein SoxZ
MTNARLQLPERMVHGEVVKARLLVQHPMDSGYLQDLQGKTVPRNIIRLLTCHYDDREIFRVEPSSGVAGNPLFEFFFRALESGQLRIRWVDDRGQTGELLQALRVQPPASRAPGT